MGRVRHPAWHGIDACHRPGAACHGVLVPAPEGRRQVRQVRTAVIAINDPKAELRQARRLGFSQSMR